MLFYVVLPCQFCKYDAFVPFNSCLCPVMMVILLAYGLLPYISIFTTSFL
jgi:hypothetical protein